MTQNDVDALDRALDRARAGRHEHLVPWRIAELVSLATEVAEAMASPSLSAGERARLLARVERLATRRVARPSRPLSILEGLRRHPIVAGAGGAVLTVAAAVAVALLRDRSDRDGPEAAASAA